MGYNTDDSSILLHLLKLQLNFFLACISVILQSILGESILLAPVLVEPPPDVFTEMLSPDSVKSTKLILMVLLVLTEMQELGLLSVIM